MEVVASHPHAMATTFFLMHIGSLFPHVGFLFGEQSVFPIHVFVGSGVFPCLGSRLGKVQWLGSLSDGLVVVYPHYPAEANHFCIGQRVGEENHDFLGVVESVLATLGPKRPWESNCC